MVGSPGCRVPRPVFFRSGAGWEKLIRPPGRRSRPSGWHPTHRCASRSPRQPAPHSRCLGPVLLGDEGLCVHVLHRWWAAPIQVREALAPWFRPPSVKTVQRHIVTRSVSPVTEFGLQLSRLEALPALLQRLGYDLSAISLAFDAVAILPSLHYRHIDGAVLGFAIDDDKLPSTLLAPPRTWLELRELLATYPLATQAEVWLVCPLDPKVPAAAVCVFTQTSSPSAPGVYRRMDVITELLDTHGLHVINVGSDGAASQLKAMKMRSGYIDEPCVRQRRGEFCMFGVVDFAGERALRIPARDIRGTLYPDFSVQDPVHDRHLRGDLRLPSARCRLRVQNRSPPWRHTEQGQAELPRRPADVLPRGDRRAAALFTAVAAS